MFAVLERAIRIVQIFDNILNKSLGANMIKFNYYGENKKGTELCIKSLNGYDLSNLHLHRLSYNDKHKYSFNDALCYNTYKSFYKKNSSFCN